IIGGDRVLGQISIESSERERAFGESEIRLLQTVASSMGVALENARLFDETQRLLMETEQRNAELAVINSIQRAVGAALDFQAVVNVVGDKLRSLFAIQDLSIWWWDEAAGLVHWVYAYEHGRALRVPPFAPQPGGHAARLLGGRELMHFGSHAQQLAEGFHPAPGSDRARSLLGVPMVAGERCLGALWIENHERDDAFAASDVQLLQTVTSSMAIALLNARSHEAERQRAAELAIVNAVQQALAGELTLKGVYEAVGDKLREVFSQADVGIRLFDLAAGCVRFPYTYEGGVRLEVEPTSLDVGMSARVQRERRTVVVPDFREFEGGEGTYVIPGTRLERSGVFVPLLAGERILGLLTLVDLERPDAFSDADVRLLETLAASMSVALENARLFDETQRLLKETEQRAAELATISTIQQGMAAELDIQAIFDLVGDKLREVFASRDMCIWWWDGGATLRRRYAWYEHTGLGKEGEVSLAIADAGLAVQRILTEGEAVIAGTWAEQDDQDILCLPGTRRALSVASVPIVGGQRVLGLVALEDYEREHAFDPAALRLLATVCASMGVALENARLFDETQRLLKETEQRATELTTINSIQQGIAAKLDFQGIVELVGDALSGAMGLRDISIRWFDHEARTVEVLYGIEHGQRLQKLPPAAIKPGGRAERLMTTRQPQVTHTAVEEAAAYSTVPGTDAALCSAFVPIVSGERVLAGLMVDNHEREHAFGSAELRLLGTVAAAMGTALENARLFDETQRLLKETEQRNAELAVINSIQQAVSAALDFQGIVDVVGDKLREVFATGDMSIRWWDTASGAVHTLYSYEHGVRLPFRAVALEPGTFRHRFYFEDHTPGIISSVEEQIALGVPVQEGTDRARSMIIVPMLAGERMLGSLHLENHERDGAYGPADLRLLETIASSMAVALLNAKSFEAERQRNAELAVINSIQQGMAATLDFQGIVELVGDKLREVLRSGDLNILWHEPDRGELCLHSVYSYEHGERLPDRYFDITPGGAWETMVRTRSAVVIGDAAARQALNMATAPGTDTALSLVLVPIIGNDRVLGRLAVENHEREHAFGESEVRFVQTVAATMGVALENARLFDETQRLLKETEQRNAELAVINSIQQGIAGSLDFQAIVDLVGDKLCEVLKLDDLGIRWLDPDSQLFHYLYARDGGQRIAPAPHPPGVMARRTLEMRQPLVLNRAEKRALGSKTVPGTRDGLSTVMVPIVAGERALGIVDSDNYERENAFAESDVRLLQTMASAMGSALLSAKSYEAERQRATELAVINSIQQGLASKLDLKEVIDLVCGRLTEVFAADSLRIDLVDRARNEIEIPYFTEHGERFSVPARPLEGDLSVASHAMRLGRPIVIGSDAEMAALREAAGIPTQTIGTANAVDQSLVYAPLAIGAESIGVLVIAKQATNAFGTRDVELITTVAASLSLALQNARSFEAERKRNAE
ncbi:MAG: GAF domain-containing protein, partial [Pseudomonadota bacterium]|nr:GAF domain-containing protein [Pseudomonadota bacterium]